MNDCEVCGEPVAPNDGLCRDCLPCDRCGELTYRPQLHEWPEEGEVCLGCWQELGNVVD